MKITSKTVREVMGGKIMTAGQVASHGGWKFDDVCDFFSKNAKCEVDFSGFERHVMAGVGVSYKWIEYSKPKNDETKRGYQRCQYDMKKRCNMVLSMLHEAGDLVLQVECSNFGWGYGHIFTTIRKLMSDCLIVSVGRKNYYAVYRLTEKGRDAVCNQGV